MLCVEVVVEMAGLLEGLWTQGAFESPDIQMHLLLRYHKTDVVL